MLDIRLIREKSDFVRERLATRAGGDEERIDDVLRIDAERRKSETERDGEQIHSFHEGNIGWNELMSPTRHGIASNDEI